MSESMPKPHIDLSDDLIRLRERALRLMRSRATDINSREAELVGAARLLMACAALAGELEPGHIEGIAAEHDTLKKALEAIRDGKAGQAPDAYACSVLYDLDRQK